VSRLAPGASGNHTLASGCQGPSPWPAPQVTSAAWTSPRGCAPSAISTSPRYANTRADTHLSGSAALSEARRATFDPTYGRYTWGKLEILKLRERARKDWGAGFTLRRFHKAMLDLGSPPPGLLGTAVERG
jgi:hypothetical protein